MSTLPLAHPSIWLRIAKSRLNKALRHWFARGEEERRRARVRAYGIAALDELCASASAPPSEEALRIDEASGAPGGLRSSPPPANRSADDKATR
jgi:hypothetical protein